MKNQTLQNLKDSIQNGRKDSYKFARCIRELLKEFFATERKTGYFYTRWSSFKKWLINEKGLSENFILRFNVHLTAYAELKNLCKTTNQSTTRFLTYTNGDSYTGNPIIQTYNPVLIKGDYTYNRLWRVLDEDGYIPPTKNDIQGSSELLEAYNNCQNSIAKSEIYSAYSKSKEKNQSGVKTHDNGALIFYTILH